MNQYLDLLNHVMTHGKDRSDRTGTGTRAVFGKQWRQWQSYDDETDV